MISVEDVYRVMKFLMLMENLEHININIFLCDKTFTII